MWTIPTFWDVQLIYLFLFIDSTHLHEDVKVFDESIDGREFLLECIVVFTLGRFNYVKLRILLLLTPFGVIPNDNSDEELGVDLNLIGILLGIYALSLFFNGFGP